MEVKKRSLSHESSQILVKLGFERISTQDLQAIGRSLQAVLHRSDNPFRFLQHLVVVCPFRKMNL